ncbi:NifU family protein [Collinsella intestinalis]|uniref:NifU family protein n=1 Tax=Collinsella intestinalis TaxID=147207 RepID=UPI001956E3EB|nr:NifU family protein [Collinsella intestinalis]
MAVNEELLVKVLDQIRPNLKADGGDMVYHGVDDDGVVSLELTGHCAGCPMSQLTLSMGIERVLKENVPGVTRVVAVNDLAGGANGMADLYDEYAPF